MENNFRTIRLETGRYPRNGMDDIEIVEFDGRELTDGVNYYGNPPHEDEVYDSFTAYLTPSNKIVISVYHHDGLEDDTAELRIFESIEQLDDSDIPNGFKRRVKKALGVVETVKRLNL